jgi:uncharacterized protein (TIGR00297 family)
MDKRAIAPLPLSLPFTRKSGLRLSGAFLLSSGIGILAYRRRSLSKSGVGGAIFTGTTITGLGGWNWGLTLVFFFVSSSLLSHFRARDKARTAADKFSKGGERDIAQVAANGGIATLAALLYGLSKAPAILRSALEAGYVGALATATADTWATELGVLSSQPPRLLTSGKVTAPGTSGGITPLGTAAAAAGALALGLISWLPRPTQRTLPLIALVSGLAGSFFDSLLGATVQATYYCPMCTSETERRIHNCGTPTQHIRGLSRLDNDGVNFLATLWGALVAASLHLLLRGSMSLKEKIFLTKRKSAYATPT